MLGFRVEGVTLPEASSFSIGPRNRRTTSKEAKVMATCRAKDVGFRV
jgi:hypothetical protein